MENEKVKAVICVLNPDDKLFIESYSGNNDNKALIDTVITPIDVCELKKKGYSFPSENTENSILCIDPKGENKYIKRSAESDQDAIVYRIKSLESILQLLGGKNFVVKKEITCMSQRNSHSNCEIEGNFKGYGGEVKVGTDNRDASSVSEKGEGTSVWKGQYSMDDYKSALELAKQTGLDKDPVISSLIEKRDPCRQNILYKETYTYHVCSDLKEARDTCVEVSAKVLSILSLDVNVDKCSNISVDNEETFEYEIISVH